MGQEMRLDNPKYTKIKIIVIGIVVAGYISSAGLTYAQEPKKAQRRSSGSFQLKETEIIGKLRDVLGSLRLSETEIVGTVEHPRLGYPLPWKDPDPWLLEEGEGQSGFLEEIYTPLDKETYSREIRSELAR